MANQLKAAHLLYIFSLHTTVVIVTVIIEAFYLDKLVTAKKEFVQDNIHNRYINMFI